jgi:hypothetical protein
MKFEFAKKTGRALALTSAIVAAVSLSVVPSSAYARGWHGGGGWHGGRWGGAGIGFGLAAGALTGVAIASSAYPYYPYSYGYGYPYYGGYAPYGYYGY